MVILLVVCLLELDFNAIKSNINSLAHVFFIGGSDNLGTGNVHGDFAVTLMFYFMVQNDGGAGNVRIELGKFVHFFLDTILKTSRCIKMTSRKLNIHC